MSREGLNGFDVSNQAVESSIDFFSGNQKMFKHWKELSLERVRKDMVYDDPDLALVAHQGVGGSKEGARFLQTGIVHAYTLLRTDANLRVFGFKFTADLFGEKLAPLIQAEREKTYSDTGEIGTAVQEFLDEMKPTIPNIGPNYNGYFNRMSELMTEWDAPIENPKAYAIGVRVVTKPFLEAVRMRRLER